VPELPEVETVRIGLNAATRNRPISKVEVLLSRTIAYPATTEAFEQGLEGASMEEWSRRGKYLLAKLVRHSPANQAQPLLPAGWLGVHLRMSGQLLWTNEVEPLHKHTRVRIHFDRSQELRFVDQRTFGQMWWIPPDSDPNRIMSGLGALGPEPLSPEFSETYLAKVCLNRDRPIKNALLDQTFIAGLGNIYVDESLFLAGLHPTRPCRSLTLDQIHHLHRAIETVIQAALVQGGTTFSDFRQISGVNGNYGSVAWVYRRAGEPCRHCETSLTKIRLAGRSCHFCPQCQQ
jgi:formamidopyrimidine-DNA glycosylase